MYYNLAEFYIVAYYYFVIYYFDLLVRLKNYMFPIEKKLSYQEYLISGFSSVFEDG